MPNQLEQFESNIPIKARIFETLLGLEKRIARVRIQLDKQPKNHTSVVLKRAFLDTFETLVIALKTDISKSQEADRDHIGLLVEILDEISMYPGFSNNVEEIWRIIVSGISHEINNRDRASDWDGPSDWDGRDRLAEAYFLAYRWILAISNIPSMHSEALRCINDPKTYGLCDATEEVAKGLFANPVRVEESSLSTLSRLRKGVKAILSKKNRDTVTESFQPTREELSSRRKEIVFAAASGFSRSGNLKGALQLFQEYFALERESQDDPSEIFSQRIPEDDILLANPEIFNVFEAEVRKIKSSSKKANALMELAKVHFSGFNDIDRVLALTEGHTNRTTNENYAAFVVEVAKHILENSPVLEKSEIERLDRLMSMLYRFPQQHIHWAAWLVRLGDLLRNRNYQQAANICYTGAKTLSSWFLKAEDRLDISLEVASRKKEVQEIEKLVLKWEQIVSAISFSDNDPHRLELMEYAKTLAKWYASQWQKEKINALIARLHKENHHPEEDMKELLGSAIRGYVSVGNYDDVAQVLNEASIDTRGFLFSRAFQELMNSEKYDRALEIALTKSNFKDANTIRDTSNLISQVMIAAESNNDLETVTSCLALLMEFPIQELALKGIVSVYKKRKELLGLDYFAKLVLHATRTYAPWFRTRYYKTIMEICKEFESENIDVSQQTDTVSVQVKEALDTMMRS